MSLAEAEIQEHNLVEIVPSELFRHIQYSIDAKRTPFIWGDPGIGKSAIIKHIAKVFGFHIEDIRLSQIDSVDLRGLPVKSYLDFSDMEVDSNSPEKGPVVEWAMPDFLARARRAKLVEGKNTLFFFDEFNSAMKNTLAAAYQLVHEYRIGCFELDKDDVVIAAGNFESNGGITTMMPTPLSNRFVHYNLRVSPNEWLDFANHSKIHPWVISYIESNKDKLHMFDDDKVNEDEKAFATPRSWNFASDLLHRILTRDVSTSIYQNDNDNVFQFNNDSINEDELMKDIEVAIAGCVGFSVSREFRAFVKIGLNMPKPIDILEGKITKTDFLDSDDISREHVLSNSCIHELKSFHEEYIDLKKSTSNGKEGDDSLLNQFKEKEKQIFQYIENFVYFSKNNFSSETFILAVVQRMMRQGGIQPHPHKISTEAFDIIRMAFERANLNSN